MSRELVVLLETAPTVSQLLHEVEDVLESRLAEVPPVLYMDRSADYWAENPKKTIGEHPGKLSLLADDAVVGIFEYVDPEGERSVTVDGGVLRNEQSRLLMAAAALALTRLGGHTVYDGFSHLEMGEEVDAAGLEAFLTRIPTVGSFTEAAAANDGQPSGG